MGRADEARRYMAEWEEAPQVESDDCPACQTHSRVQLLLDLDEPVEAAEAAGPVLDGSQSCEEVPATTFSRLLLPMLLLGKAEDALFLSVVTRRQVRLVPKMLSHLADHVTFLSLVGLLDTARRLALVMVARAEVGPTRSTASARAGPRGCSCPGSRRTAAARRSACRGRRSAADGRCVAITEAAAHFESRTRELADVFDARHGTPRFAKLVAEAEQLATM